MPDDDLRARFAAGEIDSMEAASAFGRPVSIRLPRLACFDDDDDEECTCECHEEDDDDASW